ncbi:MAG TPA: invasion associated locus B family protein [Xanthobacteraceae bacterium]|nr:invasion associated locus B family protein [Xanthobacteraceae bacterium]
MKLRMSFAPGGALRRAAGFAALFVIACAADAVAQTPAQPKPAPQQQAQTQTQPKQPAQKQPAPQQQAPAQGQQVQQQSQPAGTIPTPWTKRCAEDPQSKKQVCEISQAQIAETGQFLMSASLAEIPDNPNRIFRVVAPLGMLIQPGIRVLIDGAALQSELPYTACVAPPNQAPVCIVEVSVDQNFIAALKKSQEMWIQVITAQAPPRTIHFIFPTKEFGKVYDGPAMDLKAMEDQRKKMQEKLQKAADDARAEREKQQKQ